MNQISVEEFQQLDLRNYFEPTEIFEVSGMESELGELDGLMAKRCSFLWIPRRRHQIIQIFVDNIGEGGCPAAVVNQIGKRIGLNNLGEATESKLAEVFGPSNTVVVDEFDGFRFLKYKWTIEVGRGFFEVFAVFDRDGRLGVVKITLKSEHHSSTYRG